MPDADIRTPISGRRYPDADIRTPISGRRYPDADIRGGGRRYRGGRPEGRPYRSA
jgi:hypothetical protein